MLRVLPSQWATVCLFPAFRKSTDDAKNTHAGTGKESNEDVEFLSLTAQIQKTSTRKHIQVQTQQQQSTMQRVKKAGKCSLYECLTMAPRRTMTG